MNLLWIPTNQNTELIRSNVSTTKTITLHKSPQRGLNIGFGPILLEITLPFNSPVIAADSTAPTPEKRLCTVLESAVLGVENEGISTILVADVHTYSAEGKVLEEGVGHVCGFDYYGLPTSERRCLPCRWTRVILL